MPVTAPTTTPVRTPTISPETDPYRAPERYPDEICPQQKRELVSPDVSPSIIGNVIIKLWNIKEVLNHVVCVILTAIYAVIHFDDEDLNGWCLK